MIDIISTEDIRRLADVHGEHCVSIYLPTHLAGEETTQNPIRLKTLAAHAATELRAAGVPTGRAEQLLSPLIELHDDRWFWTHQGRGLAVFLTGDGIRTYRLPDTVNELVVVADRLHLKPLLPCVTSGEVFHVLALSQHEVRLLRGSRYSVHELALGDIPASLAEALRYDDRERQLQSHATLRTGRGHVSATFHGQGAGKDTRDTDLDRFLGAVDDGVRDLIGASGAPLVLAGVAELVARYRATTAYPHVVDGEISGNPERTNAEELHDRAWPLVSPLFDAAKRSARDRIMAGPAAAGTSVDDVVLAAHDGRVRSLFVELGMQCWGRFDAEARHVERHDVREPGDRDLLDVATFETLLAGGQVFAVPQAQLPGEGPLVAEYRY